MGLSVIQMIAVNFTDVYQMIVVATQNMNSNAVVIRFGMNQF